MESETKALSDQLPAARAARVRAEMAELATNSVFVRAPSDYVPTDQEKAETRRQELAEHAAGRSDAPGKDIKSGR